MLTLEKQLGGAFWVAFGSSHQLPQGCPRVVMANASAANVVLRLPDATGRNPGFPHVHVFNVGANAFDLTTYGSPARYAATVNMTVSLPAPYGSRTGSVTGTENGTTWGGTHVMPNGGTPPPTDFGNLVLALNVAGAKPHFTATVTTDTGSATFTLDWNGYNALTSVVRTGSTGDGGTYNITALGQGVIVVGTVAPGNVARVGLTAASNNRSDPCSTPGGWRLWQTPFSASRAAAFDRTGLRNPCDPTGCPPPPPPPTKWRCISPGNCVVDPLGHYISQAACLASPECTTSGGWQVKTCAGVLLPTTFVSKAQFNPGDVILLPPPNGGPCFVVSNISSPTITATATKLDTTCAECDPHVSCADMESPTGVCADGVAMLPTSVAVTGGGPGLDGSCLSNCDDVVDGDTEWDGVMTSDVHTPCVFQFTPGMTIKWKGKRFGSASLQFLTTDLLAISIKDSDITPKDQCVWMLTLNCRNSAHIGGDTMIWMKYLFVDDPLGIYHRWFTNKDGTAPGCYTWDSMLVS